MPLFFDATLWNVAASITTVLGFFVIIYTVLVALGQLKEMTRTRHLEAMLRVYEIIGSREARTQRRFLYTQLTSSPAQLSSEERDHVEDVSASFDRIGKLIEDGLVPKEMLFDSHCEMIIRCWIKLKPYIIYHRQQIGGRHVEHFELLANQAIRYHQKHFPGRVIEIVTLGSSDERTAHTQTPSQNIHFNQEKNGAYLPCSEKDNHLKNLKGNS